ncbi:hypothetical protein [Paenibacillus sp. FJAT-26967]|uniref:hypothetical protein n=1 Tax=Paenibacillus sp. FJAT-26967 TaxID=1729690 RepID=UPI0008380FBC|nr:hypothetical protein [Paenibacillus sp. FJAT-26967]
MLRKLLGKLLGQDKHSSSHYRPKYSSDDYRKHGKQKHGNHNNYGHNHYKKKRSSSSYSS